MLVGTPSGQSRPEAHERAVGQVVLISVATSLRSVKVTPGLSGRRVGMESAEQALLESQQLCGHSHLLGIARFSSTSSRRNPNGSPVGGRSGTPALRRMVSNEAKATDKSAAPAVDDCCVATGARVGGTCDVPCRERRSAGARFSARDLHAGSGSASRRLRQRGQYRAVVWKSQLSLSGRVATSERSALATDG